jgi:hypothetical protein
MICLSGQTAATHSHYYYCHRHVLRVTCPTKLARFKVSLRGAGTHTHTPLLAYYWHLMHCMRASVRALAVCCPLRYLYRYTPRSHMGVESILDCCGVLFTRQIPLLGIS